MTDDARRPLTETERVRIHQARRDGGICAACGRALVEGEVIWMERLAIHDEYGGTTYWRAPVGAECASPEAIRATCTTEPEPCASCGRGIYSATTGSGPRAKVAICSRQCRARRDVARKREVAQ